MEHVNSHVKIHEKSRDDTKYCNILQGQCKVPILLSEVGYTLQWKLKAMYSTYNGMDGAVHGTIHTTYAAALKTTPPSQKLGAENHMLQLNIYCS